MNQIKVLVEGYVKEEGYSAYATTSSAVLVRVNQTKILCDPGLNVDLLKQAFAEEKLKFSDIDWVFLTHSHLGHSYGAALFPQAHVIDWDTDYYRGVADIYGDSGEIPGTDLKVIKTPGHSVDHCSLLVPVKNKVYAVAGDVFWWIDDEDKKTDRDSLLSRKDPQKGADMAALADSRIRLLELADFIIPGHGRMFQV